MGPHDRWLLEKPQAHLSWPPIKSETQHNVEQIDAPKFSA